MPVTVIPSRIRSPYWAEVPREVIGVTTLTDGQCSAIASTSAIFSRTSFQG